HCSHSQSVCEINGPCRRPRPLRSQPDGIGSTISGCTGERLGNWIYTRQKGISRACLRQRRESKGVLGTLPIWRILQPWEIHEAFKRNNELRELSLVLDGEPGYLAHPPQRGKGTGCNVGLQLESRRYQPQQQNAYGRTTFQ